MNKFDEMHEAVNEAQTTLRAADTVARKMAGMLKTRLRQVPDYMLADLKKELSRFNARTGKWKD